MSLRSLALGATALAVGLAAPLLARADAAPAPEPAASAAAAPSLDGLRVLIVNDDSIQGQLPNGSDGRGLYELRRAMCDAGADVLVVGPWTVQSGQGGRITLRGPMTVQEVTPPGGYADDCGDAPSGGKVFGACAAAAPCTTNPPSPSGSPSDAAALALTRFIPDNYWADGPDLVLSGINYGQNDSVTAIHSGTVNAAVTARRLGYPTIALSEELVLPCLTSGTDCPGYAGAAAFATELVAAVRDADLLTPDLLLNVNYPHLEPGEEAGDPVLNVLGQCSGLNFGVRGQVGASGGTYTMGILPPCTETVRDADTTAMEHDDISIVPLDGDWTATPIDSRVSAVVRGLG